MVVNCLTFVSSTQKEKYTVSFPALFSFEISFKFGRRRTLQQKRAWRISMCDLSKCIGFLLNFGLRGLNLRETEQAIVHSSAEAAPSSRSHIL